MTTGAWADLTPAADGWYELATLQDWQDFATLVESTPTANARMTADIDLGDDQTTVGTINTPFQGVFDGQGHQLTINFTPAEERFGLFRFISGATIRNLNVTGSINTAYRMVGSLVGRVDGNSCITNCRSSVDINSTVEGETQVGGFVGRVSNSSNITLNISDCVFDGSIVGKSSSNFCGGFVGYNPSTVNINNCLFMPKTAEIGSSNTTTSTLVQSGGTTNITNCYYTTAMGTVQGTLATSITLSNGTTAAALQNGREDLVWGQRIGTDAEPVLTNDENYRVYKSVNGGYTNNPNLAYNGLEQDAENYYLLGNEWAWQDFAALVQTTPTANARMTADKDLGNDQTHIGYSSSSRYCGVFDGDGHTLTVNYNSSEYGLAPFRYTAGATIKNLHIDGSIISTYSPESHTSGVISHSRGADFISNVWVSVDIQSGGSGWIECAAFIGCNNSGNSTITDCLFTGSMKTTSGYYNGCFFGYSDSGNVTVSNCLSTGTFDYYGGSTYVESHGGVFSNCYVRQFPSSIPAAMQVSNDDLANGTIATALQNNREETVWTQDPLTNQPMLALFAGKYKVPASGLGTFSAKANFTLPEGLEAYYCKNYDSTNGSISVVGIEGTVPAETGVLLRGTGGETYTLTISDDEATTVTDNALVAVTEQTTIQQTADGYTNFGLSNGVFKKVNGKEGGVTIGANRAYLRILTSALTTGAREITLVWDEDATSIQGVQGSTFKVQGDDAWFTLDGRRPNGKPTAKGLYINNGRKQVIR
jgi:hypothetical protein